MIGAVILAGRPNTGALRELGPGSTDALVSVAGVPMITRVVAAAEACQALERIVVVGPAADLAPVLPGGRTEVVEAAGSLVENIRTGARALEGVSWVLILTSDIPLIDAGSLAETIRACNLESALFFYPIIPRPVYEARFPGSRRTYAKLADGTFTGGNVALIHLDALEQVLSVLEQVYELRKSPLRLAGFLGLGFVIRLLLGRLRIEELERFISSKLGVPGKAVIINAAEIGFDVDRPDDVRAAERFLPGAEVPDGTTTA